MTEPPDLGHESAASSEQECVGLSRQCPFCLDVVAFCSCMVDDLVKGSASGPVSCPNCTEPAEFCVCDKGSAETRSEDPKS